MSGRIRNIGKKKRIELIDIAKAITIFLVIWGHTTGNLDTPMFRLVLYTFHMPLFFFMAGMSIRAKPFASFKEWRSFIRKNILALVVPYLIWGLIYAPFTLSNIGKLFYGSWMTLVEMGTLSSLWYLSCLFVSRMLVQGVISILGSLGIKNMARWCGLCAILMFVISFSLPHWDIGYPWCFDVAFAASGCILLGIALRTLLLILAQQRTMALVSVLVASLALLYAGTVLRAGSLELMLMCDAAYGEPFWFFSNSLWGGLSVLSLSMLLARVAHESARPFSLDNMTWYVGQHTLGIFLIHKNLLWLVFMPFLKDVLPGCPLAVTAFIGACIALAVSAVLCLAIERYIPQLLGQFPKDEHISGK